MRTAIVTIALLTAAPALAHDAAPNPDAVKFSGTADARSATALTNAARDALTAAAYQAPSKAKALELISAAESGAAKAQALSPGSVDAALISAIATGYRAKLSNNPGLAKKARAMMEAVTKRAPDNALAWATLGGWHSESIATLGKFVAGAVIGAKTGTGIAAYERAVTLDAASPVINTLYAVSLVGMGHEEPAKLRDLLTSVVNSRGGDNFDALMRERARLLLTALDSGKKGALEAVAAKSRAFARIG